MYIYIHTNLFYFLIFNIYGPILPRDQDTTNLTILQKNVQQQPTPRGNKHGKGVSGMPGNITTPGHGQTEPETMLTEQGAQDRNQGDLERERIKQGITTELTKMKEIITNMKHYARIYQSNGFRQSSFQALEQWENQLKVILLIMIFIPALDQNNKNNTFQSQLN